MNRRKSMVVGLVAAVAITAVAEFCNYDIRTPDETNYEVCVAFGNPPPPCEKGVRVPGDDVSVITYDDMGVRCVPSGGARAKCFYQVGEPVYNTVRQRCECEQLSIRMEKDCTRMVLDFEYCE